MRNTSREKIEEQCKLCEGYLPLHSKDCELKPKWEKKFDKELNPDDLNIYPIEVPVKDIKRVVKALIDEAKAMERDGAFEAMDMIIGKDDEPGCSDMESAWAGGRNSLRKQLRKALTGMKEEGSKT